MEESSLFKLRIGVFLSHLFCLVDLFPSSAFSSERVRTITDVKRIDDALYYASGRIFVASDTKIGLAWKNVDGDFYRIPSIGAFFFYADANDSWDASLGSCRFKFGFRGRLQFDLGTRSNDCCLLLSFSSVRNCFRHFCYGPGVGRHERTGNYRVDVCSF